MEHGAIREPASAVVEEVSMEMVEANMELRWCPREAQGTLRGGNPSGRTASLGPSSANSSSGTWAVSRQANKEAGLQKLSYLVILSYLILSISSVRRPRHHAAAPSRSATPRRRGRHPTTRARAPSQERKKASREYWRFLSLLQLLRLQGGWVCRALDGGVSWNPSIHGPHAYPEAPRGDE